MVVLSQECCRDIYKSHFPHPFMIFGIDIGGANIKLTQLNSEDNRLEVTPISYPFLGKGKMIEDLIFSIRNPDVVVVTQTLCISRQLFSSAREGTHYIIDVTERLFGDRVRYLGLSYSLYTASEAREHYLKVACRNWVATCFLASYLNLFEDGLVIDCGTNSTDIVPVLNCTPVTLDDNDQAYTRFKTGELLWSGLYFTHVLSITNTVLLDGDEYQVRANANALSSDFYAVLRIISPETIASTYSHRFDIGKSFETSTQRILDLIVADRELLGANDARKIACYLAEKQREKTLKAIKKVLAATKKKFKIDLKTVGLAGAGKDIIVRKALEDEDLDIIDLEKEVSEAFDLKDSAPNCETSLGCALLGMEACKKT
ncbi:MAG: hypothetical protein HXS41_00630 [Theionarchaea archaeon]|nr:hypothetical protein [Theionarchaea archaeon]